MKVTYFTLVHSQVAIPKGLRHDVITQQELHKPRTLSGRMDKEAELALSRWRVMGADVAETTMAARVGERFWPFFFKFSPMFLWRYGKKRVKGRIPLPPE